MAVVVVAVVDIGGRDSEVEARVAGEDTLDAIRQPWLTGAVTIDGGRGVDARMFCQQPVNIQHLHME